MLFLPQAAFSRFGAGLRWRASERDDLGVGDPAIRSDGGYEVGAAIVEMKLTAEAVARWLQPFYSSLSCRPSIGVKDFDVGAGEGEWVGLSVSRP